MLDLSNITMNKHASIRIEGTKVLYFDPFGIEDEAKDADLIFVTHEHFDHYEIASISKLMKDNTVIVAPESMKEKVLADISISEERCLFCNPEDKVVCDDITVEAIAAYNVGKPFHVKENNWLGYLVEMENTRYFIAGDTDPNEDNMKVSCDVAFVPVGGGYTMDKTQAAEYVCTIKPMAVIPVHYGEVVGNPADGADFKDCVEAANKEIQVELKLPMQG